MMKRIAAILILSLACLTYPRPACAQRVGAAVNVADVLYYGTLNAEAGIAVSRHTTLHAGFLYNPWQWGGDVPQTELHRRQRSARAGVRIWPWHVWSGWWLSGWGRWQEYNRNGLFFSRSDLTEEGDAYGAGFAGGYSLMLKPRLNVEFGLGVWGGKARYRSYDCPTCGMVVDEGNKWFVLPEEAVVSLMYIF